MVEHGGQGDKGREQVETDGGQTLWGLPSHVKDLGFCFNGTKMPLKAFHQCGDMIRTVC